MTSGQSVDANLQSATRLLETAARAGAGLAVLPENFACMATSDAERLTIAEDIGSGPIQGFLSEQARRLGIWLVGGTFPTKTTTPSRVRSTCLLIDNNGATVARYDKIHLFDVELGNGEVYRESASFDAGTETVVADTPFGKLGLAICYDLRFPELFRAMLDRGMTLCAVPSAFTALTGRAHWEVLLRARAIENFVYVAAAAQWGQHANGRRTHGDAMVINPWGEVLDRLPEGTGYAIAELDLAEQARVRSQLPAIEHRRM
jgi:nitrilase